MTDIASAPEIKSANPAEINAAFGEFLSSFEAFKETNDRRLAEIERRSADIVTVDKLDRIDAALDESRRKLDDMVLKSRRPELGRPSSPALTGGEAEHKAAFDAYVRAGQDHGLKRLEEKALSVGVGQDGGYLVPSVTEAEIMRRLSSASPIRAIAGSIQVSAATYKKPFSKTGPQSGWVAETASRPQTTSPVLVELAFPTMELYAMPAATGMLLDDSAVDIDRWIAEEVETAFAEQEGQAFVTGDGITKPQGFLATAKIAETSWTPDKIGYKTTGVSAAFPAANASDVLFDLVYTLKGGFRQNATWVMNRKVQSEIRKLKDTTGHYLWQPPTQFGAPATLMNFPLVEAEDMPAIAADSYSIAFGDFKRGYLIVDRVGVRVLRDPYSAKPYVLFYTTKRVGGGVQDFDAIKLLKFGTT
ncbi:MAG: phage major capsid protein [Hyphomicrobiaceae bacterium]|nr:phage major capsid protein [Hyphomicrobiaceae bacterium]